MRLYLVQHGDAVDKSVHPERPLSQTGTRDVQQLATFLIRAGIRVEQVFHSGKCRARQTAELLADALCVAKKIDTLAGISPNDPVGPFAERARLWDGDSLVVGHLPFMAKAVSLMLSGPEASPWVDYRPGSLVCLEQKEDAGWGLAFMIRPELLAD